MKLNKDTIIIGGLPRPIGGVTTFLSRLVKAYPQFVLIFLDLYPSKEKTIPSNFKGIYQLISSKAVALFVIFLLQFKYKNKDFFFNFSSGSSLIFFLFLPKFNNNWSLMLHHGNLVSKLPKFILNLILRKFNIIYTLSSRQIDFYKSVNSDLILIEENSYVPAVLQDIHEAEKIHLSNIKKTQLKIVLGSGSPTALYQHHLLIDLISRNENTFLFLFIYGSGDLKEEILNFSHPRLKVFWDKEEDIFNYYLSNADLYVRPTLEDSFGIACADAIEFGVPVIASNVCERYSGVHTYELKSDEEFYELSRKFL